MKANKSVCASNTGFTRRYAEMLGKAAGLPVYDLAQSPQGGSALYLGWLRAGKIHGLARARKKHLVTGCCAVGLTDRPPMEKLSAQLPEGKVFYLRGGYDHGGQHGLNRLMMTAMIKSMERRPPEDAAAQGLLRAAREGADFVTEEQLSPVEDWLRG